MRKAKLMVAGARTIRILSVIAVVAALVVLVGCKGGNSCRKSLEDEPGSTGIGSPSTGGSGGTTPPPGGGTGDYSDALARSGLQPLNDERAKAGVSPVEWDSRLAACVAGHCHDMCERNFWSHGNPEGEGASDRCRLGHAGRFTFETSVPDPYPWVSENLHWSSTDAAGAVASWMRSTAGHRENMLDPKWTHVGVGTCLDEMQGHKGCPKGGHWGQLFGKR